MPIGLEVPHPFGILTKWPLGCTLRVHALELGLRGVRNFSNHTIPSVAQSHIAINIWAFRMVDDVGEMFRRHNHTFPADTFRESGAL